jgi:hypothetical protein
MAETAADYHRDLAGGSVPWDVSCFTSVDDRLRGGTSTSSLSPASPDGASVVFRGTLDAATLGGAGFTSQRHADYAPALDLSGAAGMLVRLGAGGDGKRYTLVLKEDDGEQGGGGGEEEDGRVVNWQHTFRAPTGGGGDGGEAFVEWAAFEPTYHGHPRGDAGPLDPARILNWSIMMRRWVLVCACVCVYHVLVVFFGGVAFVLPKTSPLNRLPHRVARFLYNPLTLSILPFLLTPF